MKKYDKITPEGTRDFLYEDCSARICLQDQINRLLQTRGFLPVMTPAMEFYDLFGGSRYFPQESMYKFTDAKGRLLVMRPDSTVPIARLVSSKLRQEKRPLRISYCQPVYQNRPAMKGQMAEIAQCGAELIGAAGEKADLEMILTARACISVCGTAPLTLEVGHIGIFEALLNALELAEEEKELLRKKTGEKNSLALTEALRGAKNKKAAQAMQKLPLLFGGKEVFKAAKTLWDGESFQRSLRELEQLYLALCAVCQEPVLVDLGMVHQAEYYTGVIFRGYLPGVGEPVLSGGRYDRLLEDFQLEEPAIGFAVQIGLLAQSINRHQSPPPAQVLVYWEAPFAKQGFAHLAELSRCGVACENSLARSQQEAFSYAQEKEIPWVDIVEEDVCRIPVKKEAPAI